MIERKPVVMLGGDHEIAHAALLCKRNDGIRIEEDGIERFCKPCVLRIRDRQIGLNPFGILFGDIGGILSNLEGAVLYIMLGLLLMLLSIVVP